MKYRDAPRAKSPPRQPRQHSPRRRKSHGSVGGDQWKSKKEIDRLIKTIRYHNGSISRTPSSPSVTHIVLPPKPRLPAERSTAATHYRTRFGIARTPAGLDR
ncbi:uncharacterized protein L199_004971 [Kwoniella botswanensis]|uniref:uncharacterized protein n=1 Tax=Kwoniella botswanensis TaxID=1268659 RepID=UPI00315CDEA0